MDILNKLTNPTGTVAAVFAFLISLMTELGCMPGASDFEATCSISWLPVNWLPWVTGFFALLLLGQKALRSGSSIFRNLFGATAAVVPKAVVANMPSASGVVTPEQVVANKT